VAPQQRQEDQSVVRSLAHLQLRQGVRRQQRHSGRVEARQDLSFLGQVSLSCLLLPMEQRAPNFKAGNVRVLVSREAMSEEEEDVKEGNGVLPSLHTHTSSAFP
jgi:hypothetical protein